MVIHGVPLKMQRSLPKKTFRPRGSHIRPGSFRGREGGECLKPDFKGWVCTARVTLRIPVLQKKVPVGCIGVGEINGSSSLL